MRHVRNPQIELGEIRIEDIRINLKSRDDIPALLLGLQASLCRRGDPHPAVCASRGAHASRRRPHGRPPGDGDVEDPGDGRGDAGGWAAISTAFTNWWNEHRTLRLFLGHGAFSDEEYEYQTMVDNVCLVRPELLAEVGQLIVESGHAVARKKPGEPLRGRCDSFVVETDVHYPTDVNLLWDAMRCLVRATGRAANEHEVAGWRQWRHLTRSVKMLFNQVRSTRRARPERLEAYLERCRDLVERAQATLPDLALCGATPWKLMNIEHYLGHARRQIDHVERRLLKGETIPQDEKVFSIFETHTRWISKGKAGTPVELGVPVCVLEDNHGFILHHEVMWQGSDVDYAQPMIRGDPGTLPRPSLVQLRPRLPQSRKQASSRRASGSQRATAKGAPVEGRPGTRTGRSVCRHAPSAPGD